MSSLREDLIINYAQDTLFSIGFIKFLCGELIGQGTFRDVFEYNLDKRYVIKLQRNNGDFNNILEFEIWKEVMDTDYRKHFAPISWISECGKIMIQRRTSPITDKRRPPERIPSFFTDIKESNFGWIGKQFVAHDYDYSLLKFVNAGLRSTTKKWSPHNL